MGDARILTEENNIKTTGIDRCSTLEMLNMIATEDQKAVDAVSAVLPTISQAVSNAATRMAAGGRMFYLGAGTSGRLGVLDASECPATFGVSPDTVQALVPGGYATLPDARLGNEDDRKAAEQALRERNLSPNDVVVGITAAGDTPYVLAGMEAANTYGALAIGICNNPNTPLHRLTDITICLQTGAEVIQGSTRMKAGTAQKMVLNMLSTGVMIKLGKVYRNRMVEIRALNDKMAVRCVRMIMELADVDEQTAAAKLRECDNYVKPAIAAAACGCSYEVAKQQLQLCNGRLAALIGD